MRVGVGFDLVFNKANRKARKLSASTSSNAGLTPNTAEYYSLLTVVAVAYSIAILMRLR